MVAKTSPQLMFEKNVWTVASVMSDSLRLRSAGPEDLALLGSLRRLAACAPVCVGVSRKRLIKKLIAQVSGVAVPIGPYEPKAVHRSATNAEESLRRLEQLGVDVSIEESAKKKR